MTPPYIRHPHTCYDSLTHIDTHSITCPVDKMDIGNATEKAMMSIYVGSN